MNIHTAVRTSSPRRESRRVRNVLIVFHISEYQAGWAPEMACTFFFLEKTNISYLGRANRLLSSPKRPDAVWGLPRFLYNGCQGSPRGLNGLWRDVEHPLPSSVEVKNEWSCTTTPPIRLHGVDGDNISSAIINLCSGLRDESPATNRTQPLDGRFSF